MGEREWIWGQHIENYVMYGAYLIMFGFFLSLFFFFFHTASMVARQI